ESPTRNSRAFLRLKKSEMCAINTHSQQHPSRRPGERSDSRHKESVAFHCDSPPLWALRHPTA
ncbi:hypothetical protein, partial [Pseudoalteromonas sp. TB5-MNA-CIBAN-0075]|uniref:hypothetical protein n=1 Tax=unclassified Pseudoalteromonas TaxID=194690 RepID=UPI0033226BB6